jgi:ABC-type metal ion transport system substrate-binding protein
VARNKKLPADVIKQWPDVLKDIDIDVVPVEYLESIRVTFNDGKVWEIDTKKNAEHTNIEQAMESLMEEYEDVIKSVDFRLDTVRVKQYIKKRTAQFLKKRN